MGLGSKEVRRNIYYCSMKGGRKEGSKTILDPHFSIRVKDGTANAMATLTDERKLAGYLFSIGSGSYEWEKKKVQTIEIRLVDGEDMFKIDMSLNSNMTRSVMNRILSLDDPGWLELSVYKQKGSNGYKDSAACSIRNNTALVEWAYSYKPTEKDPRQEGRIYLNDMVTEQPDPQDPTQTQKIYHKLNEFLLNEWTEHANLVAAASKAKGLDKFVAKGGTPAPAATPGGDAPGDSLQREFDKKANDMDAAPAPGPYDEPAPDFGNPNDDLPF